MSFGAFMGGVMQGAQFAQNTQAAYAKQKILDIERRKAEDDEKTRVGDKSDDDKINATVKDEIKAARARDSAQSGVVQPQPVASPTVSPAAIAGQGVQAETGTLPPGTPPIAPETSAPAPQTGTPVTPTTPAQPDAPSSPVPSMATPGFNPASQGVTGFPEAGQPGSPEKPIVGDKVTVKGIGSTSDPHYIYSRKVELAMDAGNTRLAERYRNEWYKAIDTEVGVDKKRYEKELLPKLHEIAKLEADGKLATLPEEQRVKLLKAQQEGEEMMTRHFAYGMKLMSNPITRQKGLDILSNSPLILGKHKITDVKVLDGNLIPIGEDGQPIMRNGQPIAFPAAAADQIVAEHFPGPKRETKVIPKDSKLVQEGPKRGEWTEVATGKDTPAKPSHTPQAIRNKVNDSLKQVDKAMGVDFQTGQLMRDSDESRAIREKANIYAEQMLQENPDMPATEAGSKALAKAKAEVAKGKAAGPASGEVDWRKYTGAKK